MDMSRRDALIYGGASATSLALSAGECFGKPNPPENGWSVSTEPALYRPTHNPWNRGLSPGSSSPVQCPRVERWMGSALPDRHRVRLGICHRGGGFLAQAPDACRTHHLWAAHAGHAVFGASTRHGGWSGCTKDTSPVDLTRP